MSAVQDAAREGVEEMRHHFDQDTYEIQQVLCLAEEGGEFVGAYRRWKGLARRPGSFDDVRLELADVVIAAHFTGAVLGIDLDAAIDEKLQVIFARGWRSDSAT